MAALEKKKDDDLAEEEIETVHLGYLGSQDTFYVGFLKGVGRIYQQTFVDTYSKVAFTKIYTTKTPITSADMLNDKVLPFFEEYHLGVLRILTDRGTEYCGKPDHHDYQPYLAINDIDHTRTKVRSPNPDISPRLIKIGFKASIHMSLRQIDKNYKLYFLAISLKATRHKALRPIFMSLGEISELKHFGSAAHRAALTRANIKRRSPNYETHH